MSPVIATVLLIGIVITLAGIVFIWAQGFITEGLQKRGEPIDRSCDATRFEANIYRATAGEGYKIEVNNQAEIPMYGFVVKKLGEGETIVEELPPSPVDPGASIVIDVPQEIQFVQGQQITIIPILRGQKGTSYDQFTCPDNTGVGVEVP